MQTTPSGLIIPANVADRKPPRFFCAVCKHPFGEHEMGPYQRHVARCVEEHGDELRARSLKVKAPGLFGDEAFDPEYESYVRRTGKT